jgi:hypothetical protein
MKGVRIEKGLFEKRAAAKGKSRSADARALESGKKNRAQLRLENGLFSGVTGSNPAGRASSGYGTWDCFPGARSHSPGQFRATALPPGSFVDPAGKVHGRAGRSAGSLTRNLVPVPGKLSASTLPPWACTIILAP